MLILNAFCKELGVVIKIMAHIQKNIKITLLAVLLTKLCVLISNLVKKLFFTEEKTAVYKFIKTILEEYDYFKKVIKVIQDFLIKILLCLQKKKKKKKKKKKRNFN